MHAYEEAEFGIKHHRDWISQICIDHDSILE